MKCIVFMAAITMAAMLFSTHLYSQNKPEITFRGTVVDSLTGKPLPEVIINRVCQEKKGMTVKTYLSDNEGRFNIAVPRNVPSKLEFSFLGYKVKVFSLDKYVVFRADEFKLGNMEMVQDVSKLDEIVVKARMEMYKIKGDTVVFFPRAVKTMHGDPVLEVLRRMPGVSISGNTVTIGGETVSRTYVNGKLIFGEDVMKPLTEIAADEASQIYAYDEDDEKKQILYGKNAKKGKCSMS